VAMQSRVLDCIATFAIDEVFRRKGEGVTPPSLS
jgi:hypothetical protein